MISQNEEDSIPQMYYHEFYNSDGTIKECKHLPMESQLIESQIIDKMYANFNPENGFYCDYICQKVAARYQPISVRLMNNPIVHMQHEELRNIFSMAYN